MLGAPRAAEAQHWNKPTGYSGTLPTAWKPTPVIGGNSVIAAATHPTHTGVVDLLVLTNGTTNGSGDHPTEILGCSNSSGSCGTYEWQVGSTIRYYSGLSFTWPKSSGTQYSFGWTKLGAITVGDEDSVGQTKLWTSAGSALPGETSPLCINPIYLNGTYDNSDVLMVDVSAGTCGSGTDHPHGPCLYKDYLGSEGTWYHTSDGATQLAEDGVTPADTGIFAVDDDGYVWSFDESLLTWTLLSNAVCAGSGSGSCSASNVGSATAFTQIALFNGNLYGVSYCPNSLYLTDPGDILVYTTTGTPCWAEAASPPAGDAGLWALSVAPLEVSNGASANGTTPYLWATDSAGAIWGMCPYTTQGLTCIDSSGVMSCVFGATDSDNCGACGHACSAVGVGEECVNGGCTCFPGYHLCSGSPSTCYDLSIDPNNCGACGHVCSISGETCVGGSCTCASPDTLCSSDTPEVCTNTNTDSANCGGCGNNYPEYGCAGGALCGLEGGTQPQTTLMCCSGLTPYPSVCKGEVATWCCASDEEFCDVTCLCKAGGC